MTPTDPVNLPLDPSVAGLPADVPAAPRRRATHPFRAKVFRATGWVFAGTYANQALRLGSNLILTRLLFPEAFGLMAVVNTFTHLLEAFSDVGIGPSIIQNKRGEDSDFLNTAWTMQVLRGIVLWLVACIVAAVLWYGQSAGWLTGENAYADRLLPALLACAALNAAIHGFNATSVFTLNRRLAMGRLAVVNFGTHVLGIAIMIGLALIYRSVWVLVIGGLLHSVVRMLASHWLLPGIRNRFHWDRPAAGELYRFGRWIFLSTGLSFLAQRGDRFLFAAFIPTGTLGVLAIALLVARSVNGALTSLNQHVLFPAYARLAERGTSHLRQRVIKVRLATMAVKTPILAGFTVFGQDLINLLWDERYEQAGWMLRIVAAGLLVTPHTPPASVVLAVGDSYRSFAIAAVRMTIKIAAMCTGAYLGGLPGILIGLAITPTLLYPMGAWTVKKHGAWLPGLDALQTAIGIAALALAHWYHPLSFGPAG